MKIIDFIDRVLWGTRMASMTSPTYVGGYLPHGEESNAVASSYDGESRPALSDRESVYLANA